METECLDGQLEKKRGRGEVEGKNKDFVIITSTENS